MFRIQERTVYEPISEFLKEELGVESVSEIRLEKGFVDIFFQVNSSSFITEIKLGEEEKKLAKAVAQAWEYATQRGTRNVVALVFPGIKSGQTVLNIEQFKKQVLIHPVNGYIHTDYWEQWVENEKLRDVLVELYKRFKEKNRKVDFNSVVKAIRELVQDLYEVVRQANTDEIFEEVAKKLELFVGLGEIDAKKAKSQVSMLASYLLFNQLLFYHIYKIKTKDEKIEELKPIKSLNDLKRYFSQIENIDYQPIYSINLVDKIPEHPEILSLINDVIKNLTLIRTEYITQDLAGRFFHALLPREVAKVWAAFYTNPIAAEILARLAVDRWDETVLDPACGSGTLLSACYRRKLELYEEEKGKLDEEDIKKLHKKFLEEDITGIDIMPFAAHLTTINLATQRLEEPTNVVRVASMDSLELERRVLLQEFKNGILIEPFTGLIQSKLLPEKEKVKKLVKRAQIPLSPSGVGKGFYLKPVDVVIMNPPFSDREKLPEDYLKNLNEKKELGKICGHQINLWGYFLALADLMLKPNGKIAAVVPINIARGKATEKIRNYLLENYHIRYIVKTTKDLAFSESAAFRDILLIAEKRKPRDDDLTTIVFLKKSIREMDFYKVKEIVSNILFNVESTEDYEMQKLPTSQILYNKNNFMKFLMGKDLKINLILNAFFEKIVRKSEETLEPFNKCSLKEGFGLRPEGLSEIIMVTRPLHPSRIERAFLILSRESKNGSVLVNVKNTEIRDIKIEIKLNKESLVPSIRSVTGIRFLNISGHCDYIVLSPYEKIRAVQAFSKFKGKIEWKEIREKVKEIGTTHIVIPNRINLSSPNTFIIVPFSEEAITPVGKFFLYRENLSKNELAILTIYLNSICFIVELLLNRTEATGAYFDIKIADLMNMHKLNLNKIKSSDKESLLKIWNKVSSVELPSILDQFEKRFWARVELDKAILKVLGFSDKEIEDWLPKVYDAIVEELNAMSEVK